LAEGGFGQGDAGATAVRTAAMVVRAVSRHLVVQNRPVAFEVVESESEFRRFRRLWWGPSGS